MGGARTLQALLQVPESFDYFCPLSMGWTAENIATIEQNHRDLLFDLAANRNIKLLWISMGRDDPLLARIPGTLALFDKYDIDYTYVEVPGAHEPHVWRDQLHQFAPLMFRDHSQSPR